MPHTTDVSIRKFFSGRFLKNYTVSENNYEVICRHEFLPEESRDLNFNWIYTDDVYKKIVGLMSQSQAVDKIFLLKDNNVFNIWTILTENDKRTRYSLYEKELEVIRFFSSIQIYFDFNLANSGEESELLFSGAKLIFDKSKKRTYAD